PLPGYPQPVVPFAARARQMTDHLYSIRKTAEAMASTRAVYLRHGSRRKEPSFRARRPRRPAPPAGPTVFDHLGDERGL
ncbi:MAG: hypothetical protein ACKOS8_19335, partial [Gemmataceae bacterium]